MHDGWYESSARTYTGHGNATRRIIVIAGIAWVPLLVLTLLSGTAFSGTGLRFFYDPGVHARLLAMVAYETDLGAFERLAPTDDALPGAIERIVGAARGASDPFAAVRALDVSLTSEEIAALEAPYRPHEVKGH